MDLYYNFNLVDVKKAVYIEDAYFTVDAGKFVEIGIGETLSKERKAIGIDLEGKTVMPGLFNCHIHALSTPIANPSSLNYEKPAKIVLRGLKHLQEHLKSGVTFVRDMNGRKQVEVELKEALQEGLFQGPEYFISRQCLTMTGGHGSNTGMECDGAVDCKRAAREQLKHGADFIKVMATGGIMSPGMDADSTQLDEDEMAAAVYEAHKAGKKTATHAHGASGIKNAVRAGIDSIEHGSYLDDEAIELMLEHHTALVPTLATDYYLFSSEDIDKVPSYAVKKAKLAQASHIESFKKAHQAGILIGCGTDAGIAFNPHSGTFMELILMVKHGMTPMEALQAATIDSAIICGVDDWTGSISIGNIADFIILDDNPIENIDAIRQVNDVYKDGVLVDLP